MPCSYIVKTNLLIYLNFLQDNEQSQGEKKPASFHMNPHANVFQSQLYPQSDAGGEDEEITDSKSNETSSFQGTNTSNIFVYFVWGSGVQGRQQGRWEVEFKTKWCFICQPVCQDCICGCTNVQVSETAPLHWKESPCNPLKCQAKFVADGILFFLAHVSMKCSWFSAHVEVLWSVSVCLTSSVMRR